VDAPNGINPRGENQRFQPDHLLISEVRARHIVDLFHKLRTDRERNLAPRTIYNIYSVVSALFRDAKLADLIEQSPCVLDERQLGPLTDKDPEWRNDAVFTREEVETIIADVRIPPDRRVVYALELLAGVRPGEAAALRRSARSERSRRGATGPDGRERTWWGNRCSKPCYSARGGRARGRSRARCDHRPRDLGAWGDLTASAEISRAAAEAAGCEPIESTREKVEAAGVEIHRTPTKPSACCAIKSLASPVIRWSRPVIWWHRAERSGEGSFRRLAAQTAEGGGERNRTSRHRRDRDKL